MNPLERARIQSIRLSAYHDGEYELDEWEGFTCDECGWRGLTAEGVFDDDEIPDDFDGILPSRCGGCGEVGRLSISGVETQWDKVIDKLPEEYLSGEAMKEDLPECEHCRSYIRDDDDEVLVTLGDNIAVTHDHCADAIYEEKIENPRWYDTFTDDHYWTAAAFLQSFDSVGHVVTSDFLKDMGEMYIHTNYANTGIAGDVVDHYNGRIYSAGVVHEDDEHEHSCVNKHGTCFEILIDFAGTGGWRPPAEELVRMFVEGDIKTQDYFTKEEDKIFDADFSNF